jgi:NlpC/P60 family putative phage cell wall peptidase
VTGSREQVVAAARTWLGTPWVHNARVKGHGVDCGQLLAAVFQEAGVVGPVDPGEYPQDWALHRSEERFMSIVERYAVKVYRAPLPGDVALFKFGRCVSHGGIVLEWPLMIHAYLNARDVVIDDVLANSDLARRFVGCWSAWPEPSDER